MTKRVVLIGHPVAHSLSAAMQQAAFDSLGIDAHYELWDRAPIDLAESIETIRSDEFLGANLTIPHKERVVPMLDRLTEEATATGAVNTLPPKDAGRAGPRLGSSSTCGTACPCSASKRATSGAGSAPTAVAMARRCPRA